MGWQAHPNPVKITSAAGAGISAAGGSFQVTAKGDAPFKYTLTGAPQGVVINQATGLITVPAGLSAKDYKFTIKRRRTGRHT